MLTVDCKSPLTHFPPLEQQSWEAALTELILQILQAAVAQGGANFLPEGFSSCHTRTFSWEKCSPLKVIYKHFIFKTGGERLSHRH